MVAARSAPGGCWGGGEGRRCSGRRGVHAWRDGRASRAVRVSCAISGPAGQRGAQSAKWVLANQDEEAGRRKKKKKEEEGRKEKKNGKRRSEMYSDLKSSVLLASLLSPPLLLLSSLPFSASFFSSLRLSSLRLSFLLFFFLLFFLSSLLLSFFSCSFFLFFLPLFYFLFFFSSSFFLLSFILFPGSSMGQNASAPGGETADQGPVVGTYLAVYMGSVPVASDSGSEVRAWLRLNSFFFCIFL